MRSALNFGIRTRNGPRESPTNHGGHSGCGGGPVQVVSNQILVKTPQGSEDVNLPLGFTATTGTKLYVSFDLNVAFNVIATGLPVGVAFTGSPSRPEVRS